MGVEIADGQGLHVGEHLVADALLSALAHLDHQVVIKEGGHDAQGVQHAHEAEVFEQGAEIGILLGEHGGDIIIHQIAQGGGTGGHGDGGNDDAYHHQDHGETVLLQVLQQPGNGLLGVLGFTGTALRHFHGGHYSSPPFVWDSKTSR